MRHPFVELAIEAMKTALHDFGYHTFGDKGPGEVMDIDMLATKLREYSPQEAGDALLQLTRTSWQDDVTSSLAWFIAMELQDWDELFDHPNVDEFFE